MIGLGGLPRPLRGFPGVFQARGKSRSLTHKSATRCELYGGEIVVVPFVVAGGDRAEAVELIEYVFDRMSRLVRLGVEWKLLHPVQVFRMIL